MGPIKKLHPEDVKTLVGVEPLSQDDPTFPGFELTLRDYDGGLSKHRIGWSEGMALKDALDRCMESPDYQELLRLDREQRRAE